MFCPNCGKQIPDGSKFCPYCGTNLERSTSGNVNKTSKKKYKVIIPVVIVIVLLFSLFAYFRFIGKKVITWERTYGGKDDDYAYSIQQTSDGGYIVAGTTKSFGAGGEDFYIIKLDKRGNKIWEKTYGGKDYDYAQSIQQTSDGGYIVAGSIWSRSLGARGEDFYIIKLDERGNKIWEKTYGGNGLDEAYSIQQTSDGGYIIAGGAYSSDTGDENFYVIKLDENGNK